MEARKVLQLVRKWFWLIVLAVLIGGIAGLAVSLLQPKIYESDTTLYVNSPGRSDNEAVLGDEEAAKAFAQIPQSNSVLTAVLRTVGDKSLSLLQLSSMVSVSNTPSTQYVFIGVRDSSPERAARLAAEIARQSIIRFETAATGGDQTRQFVQQQMNSLASEIKNLQQQLAQAQSASNTALIDQLNTKLSEDRTLYNELLTSYTSMSSIQVTVVQPATIPQIPVGLGKGVAIAMGMLVGLIVIVGVIILIEQTDDVVRTPEKVNQATGLSTLMTIAYLPAIAKQFPQLHVHDEFAGNGHQRLIENVDTVVLEPAEVKQARLLMRRSESTGDTSQEDVGLAEVSQTPWMGGHYDLADETVKRLPAITEQDLVGKVNFKVQEKATNGYQLPEEFLTLGVLLSDESGQLTASGSKVRSLLITSPENGDGKTLIASQVALGLARIGTEVILVDANMRKPQVHNVFNLSGRVGLSNRIGLSSILTNGVKVETYPLFDVLQKTDEPNLTILPSGPVIDSPSGLLSSVRMTAILNLLSKKAFVVIDSPAVLTSSDSVILAKKCDGILLVADARRTSTSKLNRTLEILTRVNMSILGVILNRAGNER